MRNGTELIKHQPENNSFKPLIVEGRGRRLSIVAFTDLDGTVNDETKPESERLNTIAPARDAVAILESKNIPVGIITGRSFGEAVLYQRELGSHGPIICEDGAVVILPEGHSQQSVLGAISDVHQIVTHEGRVAIVLSKIIISNLAGFLGFTQKELTRLDPYHRNQIISTLSSTPEEIKNIVGHPTIETARLSMDRLASAYIAQASDSELDYIERNSTAWGIRTFGVPLHLIGIDADKGRAIQFINKHANIFFPKQVGVDGIIPITFGNNINDLRLAEEAQKMGGVSVIVGRPGGGYSVKEDEIPNSVIKTQEAYGKGMLLAIPEILSRLKSRYNIEA